MQAYANEAEESEGTSDEEQVTIANRPPAPAPAPVPAVAKMPATKKRKSTAVQSEGAAEERLRIFKSFNDPA
jgi:hypothetical protein